MMNVLRRLDMALRRHETLGSLMEHLASIHGESVLVTEHRAGRSLTYRAAAELVARWSDAIAAMAPPGAPVVLATPNGYDQLLLCLAVSRAGCIAAPVNDQMRPAEIDHVIHDSGAELVIRGIDDLAGSHPRIEPTEPDPSDVAALFYTSGTTGSPKGAALTHRSLVGQLSAGALWPSMIRDDEVVAALPVAHIMGFAAYLGLATCGIRTYVLERFRPIEVLEAIEARHPSGFIGVPAMYRMLEEAGAADRDLSSIRVWMSGADVMPQDLIRKFKAMGASATLPLIGPVGEAAFVEGYGMVEVGGGVAAKVSPPLVPLGIGDGLGLRLPGNRFRVVNGSGRTVPPGAVGELWIKGPGVLREYWHAPEATTDKITEDGWLRTGDLVRRGPFGSIMFQGRSKHVIKSGGYSVYPAEVEAVLEEHPDIAEASVIGMDDHALGEVPVAAVRLRSGAKATPDRLVAWAATRLSHYKAPRRVVVVKQFPRTGTDKIQKEHLRELFD
jgi:acyl-CoA synthetase (AMP-forming)/AMP-acid ligase II